MGGGVAVVARSLMTATETINTSTITEYCVESSGTDELGKYLSCPAGGNMSQWGPQQAECYCAHSIDRYIQHRDFCGGDSWHGANDTCGSLCPEMWQDAISFTQQQGLPCEGCGGRSCADMMAARQPLCAGCNASDCGRLWSYVWSSAPQARRRDDERRRLQYGDCQCAQSEVDYSLQHIGAANISWPPGLGHWFSTPAKGECAEGAQLGTGGCAWRRLPQARIAYGFELVEAGFRRVDGPEVHGQTLVDLKVHQANAAAFRKVYAEHPVPPPRCG
jgi:hypothetical protein